MNQPKFPECTDCRFFIRKRLTRRRNPICGECGNGEFYEERVRSSTPSDEELMTMFGSMHDDNG